MFKRTSFVALLLAAILPATAAQASWANLSWDANPERDVVGYLVYWGTSPGAYSSSVRVGGTQWSSPNFAPGRDYYFAIQAINADGELSLLSEEVSITMPGEPRPVEGDFGRLHAELPIFRSTTGDWYIHGATTGRIRFGRAGDVPVVGDYDGDGIRDIAVWRPKNGYWFVLGSTGNYSREHMWQLRWGATGDVPVPADYDGDGQTDIAVWRPKSGTWLILRSSEDYNPDLHLSLTWGAGSSKDVPVAGDYDGDGHADVAVWRPKTGTWHVLTSSSGYDGASSVTWQLGGGSRRDVPVPADYDGDGATDIAIWRPKGGSWWVLKSSEKYDTSTAYAVSWGSPTDKPVPMDYDGDGRTDIAVWRPSKGVWYILKSSEDYNGAMAVTVRWGSGAKKDVPAIEPQPLASTNPKLAGY